QPGLLSRFFSALKNIFSGAEEAKPAEVQVEKKAPAQPGLLSRFFSALKNIFSGAEEAKPAEVQVEKKA
ncbi:hypothetical protein CQA89_33340, partial [Klebsiella pneumoniae]